MRVSRCVLAVTAALALAVPLTAAIKSMSLRELMEVTQDAVHGKVVARDAVRLDHPWKDALYTRLTVEGESLRTGEKGTFQVVFHGSHEKDDWYGVSSMPTLQDSRLGGETVLFFTQHPLLPGQNLVYDWSGLYRVERGFGEPVVIDTSNDPRLGRIFLNRTIKQYPAFKDFYGMEATIERIVGYFRYAAQGLEERKQILYLLGPVGGGKSSLAERLKALMEKYPVYVLKAGDTVSPIFESPLGLFDPERFGDLLEEKYNIERRRLTGLMSPWAVKRLDEFEGDISRFSVVKLMPSKLRQICVAKTEPGDENNQDVSALVGKLDIRKLEHFSQADPDAYSYSGGLNRTTQGMLEFVEMFKAPIKVLHPLLTATQESNYVGTENFGGFPFQGIVLAHSNEAEWQQFKNNKNNEAFIDRVSIVKVPYCLRVSDEAKIYEKLIANSELSEAPIAPGTLRMMAEYSVLTRLKEPENSTLPSKMEIYFLEYSSRDFCESKVNFGSCKWLNGE